MNKILIIFLALFLTAVSYGQDVDSIRIHTMNGLYDEGKFKEVLDETDLYLREQLHPEVLHLRAMTHLELKQYSEAYNLFEFALTKYPDDFLLNATFATVLFGFDQNERGIEVCNTAFDLAENDRDRASVLVNKSTGYSAYREFDLAYECLKESLKYDTTSIAAYVNLGALADEIGKVDEGIAYLKKAIEIDPTFEGAYANLGFIYQELGQYQVALEYYNQVVDMNPDEPLGYSNRAYNFLMLGDTKLALKDINKSIKMYPQNSYAYMVRGLIYLEQGKKDNACEEFVSAEARGFSERYGDRVSLLMKENCIR